VTASKAPAAAGEGRAGPARARARPARARAGAELATIWALMRRGLNEILRVPGAQIPGVLAPTFFALGLTAAFGKLVQLPGFAADSYLSFIVAVGFLQGAGFTGAAVGVNLARDIERGWFDRLLAAPVRRSTLLAGTVLSAALRATLPIAALLAAALPLGARWPGAGALAIAVACAAAFSIFAACWGVLLALRFRTQSAAPLMQAAIFSLVLFTTAYAPAALLAGWLRAVAGWNPVTLVLEATRQGFVGGVTWEATWPGLVTVAALVALLGGLALRSLRRFE
jgi:ABC-2 type transport system permease protein